MTGTPSSISAAIGSPPGSARFVRHPGSVLALLGAVSGLMSTFVPGFAIEGMPSGLGLFMVLTGVWFGLVVAFGIWQFATRSVVAAAAVAAVTWCAWEIAVNLAMQLSDYSLKVTALADTPRYYLSGFTAGAVGALLTWAGAAGFGAPLRGGAAAASVGAAGALLGLLLPWSLSSDHPAILFVPWQTGVAATLGFLLGKRPSQG